MLAGYRRKVQDIELQATVADAAPPPEQPNDREHPDNAAGNGTENRGVLPPDRPARGRAGDEQDERDQAADRQHGCLPFLPWPPLAWERPMVSQEAQQR